MKKNKKEKERASGRGERETRMGGGPGRSEGKEDERVREHW